MGLCLEEARRLRAEAVARAQRELSRSPEQVSETIYSVLARSETHPPFYPPPFIELTIRRGSRDLADVRTLHGREGSSVRSGRRLALSEIEGPMLQVQETTGIDPALQWQRGRGLSTLRLYSGW